jgi:hypothetical protein
LIEADREAYRHCNCAIYVDIHEDVQAESYSRSCARFLGWEFQRLRGAPGFLRALLEGNWDPKLFLVIPPGSRITVDAEAHLSAIADT